MTQVGGACPLYCERTDPERKAPHDVPSRPPRSGPDADCCDRRGLVSGVRGQRSRRCCAVASFVSSVRGMAVSALSRRGLVRFWCPGAAARPLEKPRASAPPTIPHVIPMSTFRVLKWEPWYFNVFLMPKKSQGSQITCDIGEGEGISAARRAGGRSPRAGA